MAIDDDAIVTISGPSDPDPDCLHCALVPFVNRWVRDHPNKPHTHVMLDVAVFLGELAGSLIHRGVAPASDVFAQIDKHMGAAAGNVVNTMRRPRH